MQRHLIRSWTRLHIAPPPLPLSPFTIERRPVTDGRRADRRQPHILSARLGQRRGRGCGGGGGRRLQEGHGHRRDQGDVDQAVLLLLVLLLQLLMVSIFGIFPFIYLWST